ncbi:hypothetical protein Tco_0586582 [Tanacetum coccineum]
MHQLGDFTASLTGFYLVDILVLTKFISPEHKSLGYVPSDECGLVELTLGRFHLQFDKRAYKSKRRCYYHSEMKETKAYKTYLGYATGATPPKKARNSRSQLLLNSLRETPKMPLSKKKEKVDVARGKGIEMLSDVALIKEDQYEEVRKKSLRDFHKTHPSGFGTVTKTAPSAAKIKPSVTNEGTGVKPGVPNVTKESSESEAGSWGNDEDDNNNEQDLNNESGSESDQEENKEDEDDEEEVNDKFVKTPSNDYDDEDETNITDKAEGDEDEEMDYTTSQLYDDVDIRLNEPVDTDKGVATLEKEVAELKNDDSLKTQVIVLVDEHLDARVGATKDEFMNFLSASITARITEQVKNQLPQILPKEVSKFPPPPLVIQKMVKESLEDVVLAKESSQPQYSYETAATLTEFELKKILIDKMDKSESYLAAPEHRECYEGLIKSYDLSKTLFSTYDKVYSLKRIRKDKDKDEDPSAGSDRGLKKRKTRKDAEPTKGPKAKESQFGSSKGDKSQPKSSGKSVHSEEPEFKVADSDMPQDQEENLGNDDDEEPKGKVASKRDWFTKPTQPQEPTDHDWNVGKTPQQGQNQSWLMTLASSADQSSKTFDELISTPIDFFAYIMNGLKITNLTQEILLGPAF